MQMCVNYVEVHVYFPVLLKLMQSLLLRLKSHILRNYITSKNPKTLTGICFQDVLITGYRVFEKFNDK